MKALDKLYMEVEEDGAKMTVPALKRFFITYYSPPLSLEPESQESEQELWLERMHLFRDDLQFLLSLPHHRFWSQIVYDGGVQQALDSFFVNAIKPYDPLYCSMTPPLKDIQQTVNRLVFLLYVRIGTVKESQDHFLTPCAYGRILYDHFLIDIPKLFDLCSLYGQENKVLLETVIENVFANQPKYENDLKAAIDSIVQTLTLLEKKFDESCGGIKWKEVLDVIMYLLDAWITLDNFVYVYSKSAHVFLSVNFTERIASFYENIVNHLLQQFKTQCRLSVSEIILSEAKKRLSHTRICMLGTFRNVIETCCIQPVIEMSETKRKEVCVDQYLHLMTAVLSEKKFLVDYCERFSFEDDIELLKQAGVDFDVNQVKYIEDAINTHLKEKRFHGELQASVSTDEIVTATTSECQEDEEEEDVAGASTSSSRERMTLVAMVKSVLPEFGDGFVQACLEHYNNDTEKVIDSLLEDNLPANLQNLDRHLQTLPPPSQAGPLLCERRNVFDNDEFDVFSRDEIDKSRIHFGKWSGSAESAGSVMKHSKLKKVTLELAKKLESEEIASQDLYDDDYDDTYDENMTGITGGLSSIDELLNDRKLPGFAGNHQSQPSADRIKDDKNRADSGDRQPGVGIKPKQFLRKRN